MNQRDGIDRAEGDWLSASAAARLLGIKRETLYAYASRGLVRSSPVEGSRARRYHRADLERLRARRDARAGHGAVAAGALRWGEPVLDSAITRIDPDGHAYRGRPALELARDRVTFEQVAELLWTGELPPPDARWQVDGFGARPDVLTQLLPSTRGRSSASDPTVPAPRPLESTMLAVPALALADSDRHARTLEHHRALVRRLVAALALPGGPARVQSALEAGTTARAVLVALGGRPRPAAIRAADRALVLCADHELNPSSFAARVAASAGADTYACISAALAVLSGPVHGGATERIEALLGEAARPERAVAVVRDRLRRGETIPGFGHPLYPDGDPRTQALLEDARALAPRSPAVRTVDALLDAMALAGQPPPTMDIGLVALAGALRLPPGSALALFAAGRSAGWIAHVIEQREAAFLLRPRARYVGPLRE